MFKGQVPEWGEELISKISRCTLIIGVVAKPDFDIEIRAEAIVGTICDDLKAIMFFAGDIYDWDGTVLLNTRGTRG
jgi:hypothetical protein